MVSRVSFVLLALLPAARALSTAPNAAAAGTARVIADVEAHLAETGGVSQKGVYAKQYDAGIQLDQAAFESPLFWAELDTCLPKKWRADPALKRFNGFCENLRTKEPGVDVFLENGQQLLAQYQYPGLEGPRAAYPAEHYPELAELQAKLEADVAPIAARELAALLEAKPTVDDDATEVSEEEDSWHRAAWYGWQFMSLRGAKRFMPATADALRRAAGGSRRSGPAHRFVGLARQKANCRGLEHSDGRNYMLSTLMPLAAPPGKCGIVVDGQDRPLATGGPAVILDNTFVHHVYNEHEDEDRFCLMSEIWHPDLAPVERDALATLFAAKDRFTVLELEMAPWGYDDDDLGTALKSGAVRDLEFWKEIGHDPTVAKASKKKKKGLSKKKGGFAKK